MSKSFLCYIATFLAVLELIRRHRVAYEQPELFDDIRILPIAARTES